ncbi:hypothetical protein TNCV_2889551 [Trichonephila clavipes]|nr:hypothetical protein TNCV_2889551 [Trichonephila clavipes]
MKQLATDLVIWRLGHVTTPQQTTSPRKGDGGLRTRQIELYQHPLQGGTSVAPGSATHRPRVSDHNYRGYSIILREHTNGVRAGSSSFAAPDRNKKMPPLSLKQKIIIQDELFT